MGLEEFCHYHLPVEKDGKLILACGAHLNESHAFECPYDKSEIYFDEDGWESIAHQKEGNLVGKCEDFGRNKNG